MKKAIQLILILITIFSSTNFGQQREWKFKQQLNFETGDSTARPFLCALGADGKLWVASSRVQDTKAHNAIYYLAPGDSVFKKFIDFNENGDSDSLTGNIGFMRGIDVLGNTLYITATQPYPKTQPNTVSATYLFPNFDTTQVQKYGFGIVGSGYGSYNHGCALSKDSILFAGISFGTTFRNYNFSYGSTVSGYGSYIPPAQYVMEPGGPDIGGKSFIRDVALIPNANYGDSLVPFYTSRNSISNSQLTGGIAKWVGGTQHNPVNYQPARVTDFDFFLNFIEPYPYGITVDKDGYLWVCGIDTTRRWVKGFFIDGINAIAEFDLPSQFSGDVADPNGAPMTSPCDIVISPDGYAAYVIDMWSRAAFKFEKVLVDADENPSAKFDFTLYQNFPNPFNPSTIIRFTLADQSNVKLVVTDILGREVSILIDEEMTAGIHTKVFAEENIPSGVYFYTLTAGNSRNSKKMILNR